MNVEKIKIEQNNGARSQKQKQVARGEEMKDGRQK